MQKRLYVLGRCGRRQRLLLDLGELGHVAHIAGLAVLSFGHRTKVVASWHYLVTGFIGQWQYSVTSADWNHHMRACAGL
jgi:hypothetical protein